MSNDVRKVIYGTIIGFFAMLAVWFSIIYISSCGFTFTCLRGDEKVERTPIPTLIPALYEEAHMEAEMPEFNKCLISASDFVGAWVEADAPETGPFTFVDANGQSCEGSYAEVAPLFVENSVWQSGSIGCVSCHNADLTNRSGGLDMSSHEAITASGILGNNWDDSKLKSYLAMGLTADGHSAEASGGNPLLYVGTVVPESETTPAP